jgi:hypothetical protein
VALTVIAVMAAGLFVIALDIWELVMVELLAYSAATEEIEEADWLFILSW